MSERFYTWALLLILLPVSAHAQVDSVSIGRNNLSVSKIRPGKSSYSVWFQDATTGAISQVSLWNREILLSRFNGRDVIVVRQMRYYSDPKRNKSVYTISDRRTLQTIYDFMSRGGVNEAFNYSDRGISGADSVKDNSKKDFRLPFKDF